MLNDCSAELMLWWLLLLNPITKHLNVIAEILLTKLRVKPDRGNAGKEKNQFQRILNFCSHYSLQKNINEFFLSPPFKNYGKKHMRSTLLII